MSRTLKRPMFRKGGEVMEGIMTGIQPRRNYADGKTKEEIMNEAFSVMSPEAQQYGQAMSKLAGLGRTSNRDLLTNVLIQGGLRGMSQTGGGGTLGNLAKAFEEPVTGALKQRSANEMLDVQGAMKGLEMGSKIDLANKKLSTAKGFESGSFQARVKEIQNILGADAFTPAGRSTAAALAEKDIRAKDIAGATYQGILIMDTTNRKVDPAYIQTQPDGTIHLNPFTRSFFVKKSDPVRLEPVDQITLEEITED